MSAGQIHDLGYKRYVGTRRSLGSRWRVIMRHQLATAWKTWWRYKIWLIGALMLTGIGAGLLYLASNQTFQMIARMGGGQVRFADGALAVLMPQYGKIAFFVSVLIGSTLVAGDVQSGAFTFYFARSMRPRDYVLGKLVGLALLLSLVVLAGPLLIAILRLGLAESTAQLIESAPFLLKALAIGALATLVYAAVPLGFSAVIANRRYAMALWAAYYLVVGSMAAVAGVFVHPMLGALDLSSALQAVTLHLFDFSLTGRHPLAVPLGAALGSIFAQSAIAIALVLWRVRGAQHAGIGGSS